MFLMLCFSFATVNDKQHNNLYNLNSMAAFIAFNKITVKRGLDIINGMKRRYIDPVVLLLLFLSTNYLDRTEKETTA